MQVVTIPTRRKIRARIIMVPGCNTVLACHFGAFTLCDDKPAAPCHQLAEPLIAGNASAIHFFTQYAYFLQNAFDLCLLRQRDGGPCWVGSIEDQAAKGTWQLVQREDIRVFSEKAPDLCFLPAPTLAQGLKGKNGAQLPELDRRRHMRKRIARFLVYRVTPEIQPCVRLIKFIVRLRKTLSDIPGQTQEAIAIGGIDHFPALAGSTGTFHYPVFDLVGQLLGSDIQCVVDIAQFSKFVQGFQGLLPSVDPQDAFQAHDAARPFASGNMIDIAAVQGLPVAEGGSGGQPCPSTHDALAGREQIAGELDPFVSQ